MRCLVIGGTGIIGQSFCKAALSAGHEVTVVSDGRGLFHDESSVKKDRHLVADRSDKTSLLNCFGQIANTKWDLVFDICCYSANDAKALLDALRGNIGHLIMLSTTLCYKDTGELPIRESTPALSALEAEPYERNKIAAENLYLSKFEDSSLPVTILRIPHVLGVGCDLGLLPLHNRDVYLLERIRRGLPLFLVDSGSQAVQIACSNDIAEVVLRLSEASRSLGRILNYASPEIFTASHYYEQIGDLLGKKITIEPIPLSALKASCWGWVRTAKSKFYDDREISNIIGEVSTVRFSSLLAECVHFRMEADRRQDFQNYFEPLQKEFAYSRELWARLISECSLLRPRTAVDNRMNPRLKNLASSPH